MIAKGQFMSFYFQYSIFSPVTKRHIIISYGYSLKGHGALWEL